MLTEGFIQNQKQFSNDKEKFEKSWTVQVEPIQNRRNVFSSH